MNRPVRFGIIEGVVGALVLLVEAGTAGATPQDFTTYKKTYPEAKSVSCKVCHQGAVGKSTDLNTYGKALQAFKGAGKAKALTAEDFKAFETADLDQDGIPNQHELDAGADPNDPASVPSAEGSKP